MRDCFDREINYLRISVTDRCNLRCRYCMPDTDTGLEARTNKRRDLLSFEEIAKVVSVAATLGLHKIRLTGGEPLMRKGIVDLVTMIRKVPKVRYLAMTTNGVLLKKYAAGLKKGGLDSVNISLDTLNAERYRRLTTNGDISQVFIGIDAAAGEGLVINLNMVVLPDTAPGEIEQMKEFCQARAIELRLINHYSLVKKKRQHYKFDRPPDCSQCNRIRLLADGSLKPCLHNDKEIKVDMANIGDSLRQTISEKPKNGWVCTNRGMVEIGG